MRPPSTVRRGGSRPRASSSAPRGATSPPSFRWSMCRTPRSVTAGRDTRWRPTGSARSDPRSRRSTARIHLARRYLAAFGPASVEDLVAYVGRGKGGIGIWRDAVAAIGDELLTMTDERGRTLVDLHDSPRPPADTPAPPRLLARWDSLLLSHAPKERDRVIADGVTAGRLQQERRCPAHPARRRHGRRDVGAVASRRFAGDRAAAVRPAREAGSRGARGRGRAAPRTPRAGRREPTRDLRFLTRPRHSEAAPLESSAMQVCPSCGEENPERFRLCGYCGTPLAPPVAATEERRTVTIVFSDLQGSTKLGEALDPEAVREVMSRYFDAMTTVLRAPWRDDREVHRRRDHGRLRPAARPRGRCASRRPRRARDAGRTRELNDELERAYGVRLTNRTGVNTGEVVTGDAATAQRLVTGDTVNTTARLEQAAGAERGAHRRARPPAGARRRDRRAGRAARAEGQGGARCRLSPPRRACRRRGPRAAPGPPHRRPRRGAGAAARAVR